MLRIVWTNLKESKKESRQNSFNASVLLRFGPLEQLTSILRCTLAGIWRLPRLAWHCRKIHTLGIDGPTWSASPARWNLQIFSPPRKMVQLFSHEWPPRRLYIGLRSSEMRAGRFDKPFDAHADNKLTISNRPWGYQSKIAFYCMGVSKATQEEFWSEPASSEESSSACKNLSKRG